MISPNLAAIGKIANTPKGKEKGKAPIKMAHKAAPKKTGKRAMHPSGLSKFMQAL